jgi:hypothetical protein
LKKRSKKLLICCRAVLRQQLPRKQKFFGSFFQKRTSFLLVLICFSARAQNFYLRPFDTASPWNTPISPGAVFSGDHDPNTQDLLAGHAQIRAGTWSLPVYAATAQDPWVSVHDEENKRDFRAQVPRAARPDAMGDGHLLVVDPAHAFSLEMYRARIQPNGDIVARRAFRVSLMGPGMFLHDGRYPGVRAMDASGLGGLLRVWEIRDGHIRHALTFLLPYARLKHGPVWPSSREDFWGFRDYTGHVPIGALMAIPPNVPIDRLGLSPSGLALARALQQFGAYCDDSVGTDGLVISAEGASEGMQELAAMRRDFPTIRRYVRVVENNGPRTPRGGK